MIDSCEAEVSVLVMMDDVSSPVWWRRNGRACLCQL